MKLEGKVAIVTGGGAGIGRGIVHRLAEEGADVAVIDINKENAEKAADEVKGLGRKSLAIEADLTDSRKVTQAVQEVMNTFGKIDILVNNVGGTGETYLARTKRGIINQEDAEWDDAYKLNLKTRFTMSRAVVPYFIKQRSGKIVNIASAAGKGPRPLLMAYGATKSADIHLTKSLAVELGEYNINVNCVCPGIIYTPLWEKLAAHMIAVSLNPEDKELAPREYFDKYLVPRRALKREQTAEDIGCAVVFLVSEDARNITGHALSVDGGRIN